MKSPENAGLFQQIFMSVKKILYEELICKIKQIDILGITNVYITLAGIISKDTLEGDVVISPSLTMLEYAKAMQNPSKDELPEAL